MRKQGDQRKADGGCYRKPVDLNLLSGAGCSLYVHWREVSFAGFSAFGESESVVGAFFSATGFTAGLLSAAGCEAISGGTEGLAMSEAGFGVAVVFGGCGFGVAVAVVVEVADFGCCAFDAAVPVLVEVLASGGFGGGTEGRRCARMSMARTGPT